MFFASDKDLRKGVAKKKVPAKNTATKATPAALQAPGSSFQANAAKSGGGDNNKAYNDDNDNSDDIVQKAKREREQREHLRKVAVEVTKVQGWWRGRSKSCKFINELQISISKKLNDVGTLKTLLAANGGIFVTPPDIAIKVTSQFLLLCSLSKLSYCKIASKICSSILSPSLSAMDGNKTVMKDSNHVILGCFVLKVCALCHQWSVKRTSEEADILSLVEFLNLCAGDGLPYKMRHTVDVAASFCAFRKRLADNGSLYHAIRLVLTKHSLECFLTTAGKEAAAAAASSSIIDHSSGKLATATAGVVAAPSLRPAFRASPIFDGLIQTCMFLTHADHSSSAAAAAAAATSIISQQRLEMFLQEIFTVPMLTLLLSPQQLSSICTWQYFPQLLDMLQYATLSLHLKYATVGNGTIHPKQWLAGNIVSLLPFIVITGSPFSTPHKAPSSPVAASAIGTSAAAGSTAGTAAIYNNGVISDDLLQLYLVTCFQWISQFALLAVMQGRGGIVWQRNGASLSAVAAPVGLEEQFLCVYDVRVLKDLYSRVILPTLGGAADAQDFAWENLSVKTDVDEVRESLNSTGRFIASTALKDQQDSASSWFTSKWASHVAKSVTKVFSFGSLFGGSGSGMTSSKKGKKQADAGTAPVSASSSSASSSAAAAAGDTIAAKAEASEKVVQFRCVPVLCISLCRLWSVILSNAAVARIDSAPWRALSFIAFSTQAVPALWVFLLHRGASISSNNTAKFDSARCKSMISSFKNHYLSTNNNNPSSDINDVMGNAGGGMLNDDMCVIITMSAVLRVQLIALDDSELYLAGRPIPLDQVLQLLRYLKIVLFSFISMEHSLVLGKPLEVQPTSSGAADPTENKALFLQTSTKVIMSTMADLYGRWARRPFCSPRLWEIDDEATAQSLRSELQHIAGPNGRSPLFVCILHTMPWVFDFHSRMQLFRRELDYERERIQGIPNTTSMSRGIVVRVRKARVLEDGMAALSRIGGAIKDRVVVKYINDFGEEEIGIDMGGLFKDFIYDLADRVFDPSYGLFCLTSSNLLYPNPAAPMLFDHNEMEEMYLFVGRILGKAMLENITLQPQFAHFFLAFMHGKYNFMNLLNDLSSLDEELFKNLMFLKTYEGDVEDLCLTFSVTDASMGGNKEVELIPGGSNMDVTSKNKHRYINLTAKYYLHDRLRVQSGAFFAGLLQVVHPDMLAIFCAPELQVVISGAQAGIDLDDLRRNSRYLGGYTGLEPTVVRFWKIVENMSSEDKALLIKFVTACERPPSLGFSNLSPPFSIQRVAISDDSRLPTASTCFNVLKLPTYSSKQVMEQKLLAAIRSKSGFDLS